jgi:phospholipid transport system transporter-binding protein
MSAPTVTLEAGEDGAGTLFRLRGQLGFAGVPGILASGRQLFPASGVVRLDLGGLDSVNSAGLALLLEWQHEFRHSGREMKLLNVPASLINIARVSELEPILAITA